jgi:hypothetical protein
VLVGLAVDSQLGQNNLSFVRITSNEMDGGELFAGRAAQTFPIDGDRRPTVSVGLRLEPSADRRFKSLDINRPKDDRERTLGQGFGCLKPRALTMSAGRFRPKSTTPYSPRIPAIIARTKRLKTAGSGCCFPSARQGSGISWSNSIRLGVASMPDISLGCRTTPHLLTTATLNRQ